MKVTATDIDWDNVPGAVRPFVSKTQTFVTPGQSYVVHAVSVYKQVSFFLVIDDLETPVFLPAALFVLVSNEVPVNWVCNVRLGDGLELVLGPPFVAGDIGAYGGIVDQEADQMQRFWDYVAGGR